MARKANEAFRHTADVANTAGLTLLTTEWFFGAQADYRFRCLNGHEFGRRATVWRSSATNVKNKGRMVSKLRHSAVYEESGEASEMGLRGQGLIG
jgi:hypothetical protein